MKRNANVMVFDNGGKTFDRYTVYIHNGYSGWDCFTMSQNATAPDGFNQYVDTFTAFNPDGKRVALTRLPQDVQVAIKRRKSA